MTAAAYRPAQLRVQALNGIGRVDHFPYFLGIGKEGDDVRPMAAPERGNGCKSLAPGTVVEIPQRGGGGLCVGSTVDGS